jgi:hypothetical protein
MSVALRQHNDLRHRKGWWRRYFWSRDEFWAKHAVHRAAIHARSAAVNGTVASTFGMVSAFWPHATAQSTSVPCPSFCCAARSVIIRFRSLRRRSMPGFELSLRFDVERVY